MVMMNKSSPLVVVVMMVKDEALSITLTLKRFLQEGLAHFVIFDTGSTDDTVEKVRTFFHENDCIGYLKEEPFIDFSTSRNHALEFAKICFSHAHFFLMSDAEWYFHGGQFLQTFSEQEKNLDTPLYLIDIHMNGTHFTTARLFRGSQLIRFKGVVHEAPEIVATVKCPDRIYFDVKPTDHGIEKSKRRWRRDLLLLTDAFQNDPEDPRTAFYLAQTYECLGQLQDAFRIYQHREFLPGWDEENFITYFRLGYLAEHLSQSTASVTWEVAMNYYLKAFALRPHRIEPLVKLAAHFWPSNIPTCFLFINHAYHMPYPKQDTLFIEQEMYRYDRYEIMSRCAWHVGEFKLGEEATLQALKVHPETPHLKQNLRLYQSKTQSLLSSNDMVVS